MARRIIDGPEQDYLTLSEAAAWLHLSESSLRRLIAAGRFPEGIRMGGVGDPVWPWIVVVSFAHLSPLLPLWKEPLPPKESKKP